MNVSRQFILRPVATGLFMLAIVLAGLVGLRFLPLSALPQVDYPTIQVQTLYPGASPDVMTATVTAPLERQFGQMQGLTQMSSTSSGGASVITLRFSLDVAMDVAEQEVQAAINAGSNLLPGDLPMPPPQPRMNLAAGRHQKCIRAGPETLEAAQVLKCAGLDKWCDLGNIGSNKD